MSRWHEANRPHRIFNRLRLSQRFKLNLMWIALTSLLLSNIQQSDADLAEYRRRNNLKLWINRPLQKGTTTPLCLNSKWLSCGVQSITAQCCTWQCSVWESCNVLQANGFDNISLFNKPGYDTAHCIRFLRESVGVSRGETEQLESRISHPV